MSQTNDYWGPVGDPSLGPEEFTDSWRKRDKEQLEYLDRVIREPKVEQERFLRHILEVNGDTEYLRDHGMNGATDVDSFRKRLPVVSYEAYSPYIERIINGDTSPVLTADPPVEVLVSSGTSSGDPKLFPVTEEDLKVRGIVSQLGLSVLNRALPSLTKGKFMRLIFARESGRTPGGLRTKTGTTSFIESKYYKNRPFHPIFRLTSPDEIFDCVDTDAAMYCHLLCGLLQRHQVVRLGASFPTMIVQTLRALEKWLPEICEDIATGSLSKSRVPYEKLRSPVLRLLQEKGVQSNAEMAESIRKDCISQEGFLQGGIVRRLWPKLEVIDTGGTGVSKAYLPALARYSDNIRVICTPFYGASEGFFGLNINPSCPPGDTFYVLIPTVAYYEFIPIKTTEESIDCADDGNLKEHPHPEDGTGPVLDLVNLKVGEEYEVVVSTVSGYYRLRIGDVLKVVGFHNTSPMFEYMRRANVILSVNHDKTNETELHQAVSKAAEVLERELPGLSLVDYTSRTVTDLDQPGHYVIFWELSSSLTEKIDVSPSVMDQCCTVLEESLSFIYREGRHENIIGPLELRLMQPGTFDLLFKHAVSKGVTVSQYKVPRAIGSNRGDLLNILDERIALSHFSKTKPTFNPGTYRSKPSAT